MNQLSPSMKRRRTEVNFKHVFGTGLSDATKQKIKVVATLSLLVFGPIPKDAYCRYRVGSTAIAKNEGPSTATTIDQSASR